MFHYIIGGVIFVKHVNHLHNVFMMKLGKVFGLFSKFVPIVFHQRVLCALNVGAVAGAHIDVFHVKLFHGHVNRNIHLPQWPIHLHTRVGHVGDAEGASPQHS